jgi:DNA-binding CsgD family transcriptional regulator
MASGLAPVKRRGRDWQGLIPQELCVAGLAASGLSNREVASDLMPSVKSVEFHLSHAYRKLVVGYRKDLGTPLQ